MLPRILAAISASISLYLISVVSMIKSLFCHFAVIPSDIKMRKRLSMSVILGTDFNVVVPLVNIVEAIIGKSAFLEFSTCNVPKSLFPPSIKSLMLMVQCTQIV